MLSGKYVTSQSSRVNYPLKKCTICVSLRSPPEGLWVGMKIMHVWRLCLCMCRLSTQGPLGDRGERGEPGDEGYQVDKTIK